MNFYKRHLGDIAKACGHLSQGEMGAYDLLLDWLYSNEKPLPLGMPALWRIGRASSKAERENVTRVVGEFFERIDAGFVQKRALEEMAKANAQAETNRRIAEQREEKKRASIKAQTEHESLNGSLHESCSVRPTNDQPSQTPDSRQQQELPTSSAAAPPDPDPIFGHGLAFLRAKGVGERGARSFLGAMRKACGDVLAAELLAKAEAEDVSAPVPWLRKAYEARVTGPPRSGKPSVADSFAGKTYTGTPDHELPAFLRSDAA
ncbi:YdaU family protein [Dokdonella soli]|uniref:DUF1376 domain-containing protein n=1 Tax=Dokdonella soli TaxID=529810 RepID=A0ABP3U3P7_9GAMM